MATVAAKIYKKLGYMLFSSYYLVATVAIKKEINHIFIDCKYEFKSNTLQ